MVLHGSPYSGNYPNTTWPGYTTFGYSYTDMWNRIQPCWQHLTDALKYIGRNQYVLQQGVPKIDLAFYLYEAPYTTLHQYSSTNLDGIGKTSIATFEVFNRKLIAYQAILLTTLGRATSCHRN